MIAVSETNFNFNQLRGDFPLLQETNRSKPIIYLDSAASAQKPQQVIDAMSNFICWIMQTYIGYL